MHHLTGDTTRLNICVLRCLSNSEHRRQALLHCYTPYCSMFQPSAVVVSRPSEGSRYSCAHSKRGNKAEKSLQQWIIPKCSATPALAACSTASTIRQPLQHYPSASPAECVIHVTEKLLLCTQCFYPTPHPLLSDYTPCSCSWGLQCKPPRLSRVPTLQTLSAMRWEWTRAPPPGKGHTAGADGRGMTRMILSESSCPGPFHQPGSRCCSWKGREQTEILSECVFPPLPIYCAPAWIAIHDRDRKGAVQKHLSEHFQVDPRDIQTVRGTTTCKKEQTTITPNWQGQRQKERGVSSLILERHFSKTSTSV